MSDELPEGWRERTLSDLCTAFEYGSSQKSQPSGKVPVLRMGNIQEGEIDWSELVYSSDEAEIRKYALSPNTVLFNRTNSPELVGKTSIYRGERPAIFAGYLIRVLTGPELHPAFLNFALNARGFKDYCERVKTDGVSQSNINASKLAAYSLNWCPIAEQERIVAKVEALLARVNAARQRLAKVPSILKRFRQAVLAAACSGNLTKHLHKEEANRDNLPAGWRVSKLGAVATRVTDGTHLPPPLAPSGIPFLLIGNVIEKKIDWSGIRKWVSRDTYESLTARCRPVRGDVLYTAVGATFGQALAIETDRPFIFQRHIAHIKANRTEIVPEFLVHVLNSPKQYQHATEVARGAAQPTVTLGDLKEFEIPVPPLAEQHEIVRRVDALFQLANRIEQRVATAMARADKLTQAILAKAFRGELVPTEAELARREGRSYEPASVLLERIRAERTSTNGKPAKRRAKPEARR